jgi:acyl-CoA thioester hydrolase
MVDSRQPFRFRHSVDVRFKDIDVGGHAHHSHALVYFEEARAAYWGEVTGRSGLEDIDYILAEATVRWHQRVLWPARLDVAVRVSLLARKHLVMEYRVASAEGVTLISGSTVQVMYDYVAGASKRIPEDVRAAIAERDGPFGAGGRWAGSAAEGL